MLQASAEALLSTSQQLRPTIDALQSSVVWSPSGRRWDPNFRGWDPNGGRLEGLLRRFDHLLARQAGALAIVGEETSHDGFGDVLAVGAGLEQAAILVVVEVADLQQRLGGNGVVAQHRRHPLLVLADDLVAHR